LEAFPPDSHINAASKARHDMVVVSCSSESRAQAKQVSEMRVTGLTVDLLQDQATVALFKQPDNPAAGKPGYTTLNTQSSNSAPGDRPESDLKRIVIEQVRRALHEALGATTSLLGETWTAAFTTPKCLPPPDPSTCREQQREEHNRTDA
jgi:hypothetical protein